MSEAIPYLLILLCAVGGPWLTMVIMTKARRQRVRQGVERGFENHLPPIAPQKRHAAPHAQIATKQPAMVTGDQRETQNLHARNPVRALLPPGAGAPVGESKGRLLSPAVGREPKSFPF